jgi:hypothetical protein
MLSSGVDWRFGAVAAGIGKLPLRPADIPTFEEFAERYLNADFDLVPDLDLFARDLTSSFDELRRAAGGAATAEST